MILYNKINISSTSILKKYLKELYIYTYTETKISSICWVYSPDGHNGWAGPGQSQGARSFTMDSHVGFRGQGLRQASWSLAGSCVESGAAGI